jgi:Protein of unknown function (DUF2442)
MEHQIVRIVAVKVVGDFALDLRFDDGSQRIVDLSEVLVGEIYGPLRDPAEFARVALDAEAGTVTWPCGADFDPATLHDWPANEQAWREMARAWQLAAAG